MLEMSEIMSDTQKGMHYTKKHCVNNPHYITTSRSIYLN